MHAFPPLPDPHGLAVLALVVVALYLFSRERLPLETSCLMILAALVLGFEIFPYRNGDRALAPVEFFYGFGHEALVAVCALMIVGHALETTGALRPVASALARAWTRFPSLSLLLTLIAAAVLSAFINNTPVVVMLLPILVGVSMRGGTPASGVLMPMGFATLVGGMATTIGTSTNLLVVSIAAELGLRRFEMFDFIVPALIAGAFAMVYLWLVAPRLLPERAPPLKDASPRVFEASLHITGESAVAGKTLADALKATGGKMRVEALERGQGMTVSRLPTATVQAGDRLRVRDTPERLKEFEEQLGAQLHGIGEKAQRVSEEHPLSAEGQQLAEVVVTDSSPLIGRTLAEVRFADFHQLIVLAIHRSGPGRSAVDDVAQVRLGGGDVLLVQGAAEKIAELKRGGRLLVLDGKVDLPQTRKAPLALAITVAVIAAAAFGFAPIAVSALAGVVLLLLTRCLDWEEATAALSVQVIMIVAASLALGLALMRTGGADYLAQLYVALAGGLPPALVMSGLMLVMAVLTNIVSNNAAAVIGTPVAVNIAQAVGAPAEPFVLAVLFGANLSFATPMAYKTNLLVFAAGGYRFSDFVRAGVPLLLLMWVVLSAVLARLYSL